MKTIGLTVFSSFLLLILCLYTFASEPEKVIRIPLINNTHDLTKEYYGMGMQDLDKNSESRIKLPSDIGRLRFFKIRYIPLNYADTLFFITGLSKKNDRVLYVDNKLNRDFNDDKPYVFSATNSKNSYFLSSPISIIHKFKNNGIMSTEKIIISVLPYRPYYYDKDVNTYLTNYSVLVYDRYFGFFNVDSIPYRIDAGSRLLQKRPKGGDLVLTTTNLNTKETSGIMFIGKDSIYFGSSNYFISAISENRDTLLLTYLRKESDSAAIGNKVANFRMYSLSTDSASNFYDRKPEYTLIDFWGTWCGPCIAELPNVEKIYQKYSGKGLKVISIAFARQPSEINETKDFVAKKSMKWEQFYDIRAKGNDSFVLKRLGVTSFPTVLLLDEHFNIIERAEGTYSIENRIRPKLEKIFPDK